MPDFWDRILGGTPPPPRDQAPIDAWWSNPRPAPALPAVQTPAAPAAPPPQAQSASSHERCPNCDSGNYFRANSETKLHCYTCGYPVLHTTSGMSATDQSTATPTRQVNKEGGFRPQQIIGRVR